MRPRGSPDSFLPSALSVPFQCVIPDWFPGQPHLSEKSLAWIPQEGQRLALYFSMVFWAMLHHCPLTFYSAYPLERPTRPGPLGSITVFLSPSFHAKHTFRQWCCSFYVAGCFRKKEELVGIKTLAEQAWCLEFAIRDLYIQSVCSGVRLESQDLTVRWEKTEEFPRSSQAN